MVNTITDKYTSIEENKTKQTLINKKKGIENLNGLFMSHIRSEYKENMKMRRNK